ncbi:HipA N-terminal domain-containing protein [bacterium]|nr:HipA N-terminal domain-containing protein [bacterium]
MRSDFRKAVIYSNEQKAGILEETEGGYKFTYEKEFIQENVPISISLPLRKAPYEDDELFPFFQGLLPEGWYLEVVSSTLKIDKDDDFGILLSTCRETIGSISVEELL